MKQKITSEDKDFFCEYGGNIIEYMNGVTDYVIYLLICREHGIKPKPMTKDIRKFCCYLDKMSNIDGLEVIDSIADFSCINKKTKS